MIGGQERVGGTHVWSVQVDGLTWFETPPCERRDVDAIVSRYYPGRDILKVEAYEQEATLEPDSPHSIGKRALRTTLKYDHA